MKKIISVVLAMALCLSVLAGCSGKQNPFSIQLGSGEIIAYGMQRSEVEKMLGTPKDDGEIWGSDYSCGLSISYRDEKVVVITTDDVKQPVKTGFGVSIGDSVEQCKKILGEPNSSTSTSLEYIYQLSDGKFSLYQGSNSDLSKIAKDNKRDLQNFIDIEYEVSNNKISYISIMDLYFANLVE